MTQFTRIGNSICVVDTSRYNYWYGFYRVIATIRDKYVT